MAAGNLLVTQGTQTALPIDTIGTVDYPISKIDVGNLGSSVPWQGSVTVTAGTVSAGTVNTGTVDTVSQLPPGEFGTVINSGTSTLGTLKALVSGSTIYITDLIISVGSASNVALYNGGTASPIAGTYEFAANGGLTSNYRTPLHGSSGSAILYQQSTNGPLMIEAHGFVK